MKESTKDQGQGKAHEIKGKIKKKAGQITGDPDMQAQGVDEETSGKVQKNIGKVKKVFGR